jgi:ATPase family associated with various cellular activities (AAA)
MQRISTVNPNWKPTGSRIVNAAKDCWLKQTQSQLQMARTDSEYADRYAFYMAYEQVCGHCRRPLEFKDFEIDHIIPQSAAADEQNWQNVLRDYGLPLEFDVQADKNRMAACRSCNGEKRERLLPPGQVAILHSTAAQKAHWVRTLREESISERSSQRLLAGLGKALLDGSLQRDVVFDLLGDAPQDLVQANATPWPKAEMQARFLDLLGTASEALLNWPQEIEGQWLPRPELDEVRTALFSEELRLIALIGPPGCGKSALLARLGRELRAAEHAVLAIKADALPSSVDSLAAFDTWLRVSESLPILLDRIASAAPVTLLIDQLDALSDLMDLHSERLAALLSLINRVLATPGIRVIISCREFDAEYDLRLSSLIKAEHCSAIRLSDPPWEQIEEFLRARNYLWGLWPGPLRDILRRPHHLKLFVRYFSPTRPQPAFTSYQAMLEQVIDEAVVGRFGAPTVAALETLAMKIAETEELWVPRAALTAAFLSELPKLQAAGVVKLSPDNLRVGFEHQTFFEFIQARSFVSSDRALVDEALSRQDGLAVRSVLWGAVNYLRNADRSRYCRETGLLLRRPDVRLHVKVMVVEFLGSVVEPQWEESEWLQQLLSSDKLRPHVMRAIEKKPAWWVLMKHVLLECGESGPLAAWHASWVIGPAMAYDKEFILPSIEARWLPRTDIDFAAFNLFRDFQDWDLSSCAIVQKLLSRTPFDEMWVCKIAQSISKRYPDTAVRLLRRKLDADLQKARAECGPPPEPLPPDASDDALIDSWLSDQSLGPIEKLVQERSAWYGVDIVAEAGPRQFVEGLWDWVEAVSLDLTVRQEPRADRYREDYKWSFGGTFMSYLSQALWTSVSQFASDEPDGFIEWAKQSALSEAMSVHHLILRGFEVIVSSRPEAVLEYFLGEQRRFAIADSSTQENVADLMKILGSTLKPSDVAILVAGIEKWEPIALSDTKDENKEEIVRVNNRARMRLLARLPRALLRIETRDELERSPQQAPFPFSQCDPHGSIVKGPVMMDQMERLSDSELVAVLEEYPESRGMDLANGSGGAGNIAIQFEELAKKDPDRMFRILPLLQPGRLELAAAAGISGICQTKAASEPRTLDLIHAMVALGFDSDNFRERLCWSLVKVAERTKGLPDRTVNLLIQIARSSAVAAGAEASKEQEVNRGSFLLFSATAPPSQEKKRSESILWSHIGGVLPHGSYPALIGIMLGLLRRQRPDYDRSFAALQDHLALPDDPRIWHALLNHLRYLGGADAATANAFIQQLFEKYPAILPTIEGARFVASSHLWFTQTLFDALLATIEGSGWEQAHRAVGEILLLRAALSPEDVGTQQRLASAIDNLASVPGDLEYGIVRSASNTWANPRFRATSHRVLMAATLCPEADVSDSIMDAFSGSEGHRIPADSRTAEMLRAITLTPARFISSTTARPFIKRLKELLQDSFSPLEIAQAARSVIDVVGDRIGDVQSAFYTSSDDLVDMAITLQRFAEARVHGTWIFEQMIIANAYKIEEAVRSLDRRL